MKLKNAYLMFFYIIINVSLILLCIFFIDKFNLITILSLLEIIMSIVIIFLYKKDLMLVGVIFLVLTYLFHFGQSLISTFSFNDKYAYKSVLSQVDKSIYINAEIFAMLCIFAITIGYLFSNRNTNLENKKSILEYDLNEMTAIKNISIIVLIVSLIPMMYLDITKIITLSHGGYEMTYETYGTGFGKYMYLIGQFGRPAITVLLFSLCNNKKLARKVFIYSTLYYIIMMLSGDRGTFMIYIISNVFVYFKFCKRLSVRTLLIFLILFYFLFGFISAISIFRYTDFSVESFVDAFIRRKDDGVLYSILREFGGTMLSLTHSLKYIPSYSDYNYGMTYLLGWLNVLPYLPEEIVKLCNTSFTFVKAFPTSAADFLSLGGSFLGELYFNFGWFGCLFSLIIGAFIGRLDICLNSVHNPRKIAFYIVLLPMLLLWVRDFFPGLLFKTFWLSILIFHYKKTGVRNKCEY